MDALMQRITINPDVCHGKPTIRNMRFTVTQLLGLLASGMTTDEILTDYPYLQTDDIKAALHYAQVITDSKEIIKTAK